MGERPIDLPLSPEQRSLVALADRLRSGRRTRLTFVDVPLTADGEAVQRRLRASGIGSLMLPDGASLSAPGGGDYYPDLGLVVGRARIAAVGLRIWLHEFDKFRIDPEGPAEPPYRVVAYPGEKNWVRQIDVRLWYTDGTEWACQTISISTASERAGRVPDISRDVSAPAYAETGYEGHNQKVLRRPTANQARDLLALITDLSRTERQVDDGRGLG